MIKSAGLYLVWAILLVSAFDVSASDESGIYSESLRSNYKLVFSGGSNDYTEAPLNQTLHSFTVSMWLKASEPQHFDIFKYKNYDTDYAIALRRSNYYYYLYVNGNNYRCTYYLVPSSSPSHILVTWDNEKGIIALYKDHSQICSSTLRKGDTVKKGGAFQIGGYRYSGEIAYLNVYHDFVNTTEEISYYGNRSLSDPGAIIPWEEFRLNTHGSVRILPEYDIFKDTFSHLICHPNGMELILIREGFDFMDPDEMVLLNDTCRASTVNSTHMIFYTDLGDCGTRVTYTNTTAVYHNEVRQIGTPRQFLRVDVDVINRRNVDRTQRRISLDCHYNIKDVHHPIYAPHITNIHNEGYGENRFGYQITLYHSENFTDAYTEKEYPINVEMEKEVFVEVAIKSTEQRLDTWITHCRATPSANYDDSVYYDLINNGCPNSLDESIRYYNTTELGIRRFSFQTFRFNKYPTAVVFLHCQVQFCIPTDVNSRCKQGLDIC